MSSHGCAQSADSACSIRHKAQTVLSGDTATGVRLRGGGRLRVGVAGVEGVGGLVLLAVLQ